MVVCVEVSCCPDSDQLNSTCRFSAMAFSANSGLSTDGGGHVAFAAWAMMRSETPAAALEAKAGPLVRAMARQDPASARSHRLRRRGFGENRDLPVFGLS
jgi:hypothetical protein